MKSIFDVPNLFRNKIRSSRTISNEEETRKNPEIRISWRNYPRLIPSLKENHGRGFSWCVMVKRRSISFREPRHREESVARLGSFWLIGQYSLLAPRGSCITRRDVEKLPDWDAPINNPRVHSSSLRSYTHACNYSRNATWNWTVSWTSKEKYSSLVPPTTTKTRLYAGYEFEPTCFALWFIAGMIGLWNASERFEVINFRIFLVLSILKCWKKILQFLRIRINAIFKLSKNSPPRDPRDVDLKLGNYLDIYQGSTLPRSGASLSPIEAASRSPYPWTRIVLWRPSATPVMRLAKNSRAKRETKKRRRWSGSRGVSWARRRRRHERS